MSVALPPAIGAEIAQSRANVALSSIKASAQADQDIARILEDSLTNVPASSRGGTVNITA